MQLNMVILKINTDTACDEHFNNPILEEITKTICNIKSEIQLLNLQFKYLHTDNFTNICLL